VRHVGVYFHAGQQRSTKPEPARDRIVVILFSEAAAVLNALTSYAGSCAASDKLIAASRASMAGAAAGRKVRGTRLRLSRMPCALCRAAVLP
jgi:hypothetical protein